MKIKTFGDLAKIIDKYEKEVSGREVNKIADSKKYLLVCGETGCLSSGCKEVQEGFAESLKKHNLEDKVKLIRTGCHGICELGPVAIVNPDGVLYTKLDKDATEIIVTKHFIDEEVAEDYIYRDSKTQEIIKSVEDIPFFKYQKKNVRRNSGIIDPEKIEDYFGTKGYKALADVLSGMKPNDVIETVKLSGLRGRGGGGFPTGKKWELTTKNDSPERYIVCNADEGDPGAFMDRSQLEGDPHSVIEGMLIAGFAIGAKTGYVYCRAEYPLAIERLEKAIFQAREYGLLGNDVLGSGFSFDIEIRMGAGAFVCGEETALIASIQGKRGEPQPKPPFPAQEGVWGKPTVVNNVETFANVTAIFKQGVDEYLKLGIETSRGTKVFALAGAVKNVGLIEVHMGISLGKIIYDIGGGIADDKEFKAVQIGGPSGGCLSKEMLNTPIDYESLKDVGAMMGSGGLIVMNEDTCMVDLAKFFLEFVQDESCGKCPPCRIGTKQMLNILEKITEGKGELEDIDRLLELGENIKVSAICGLGQTAPNPVLSTIKNFRQEYIDHIVNHKCTAGVCPELVYAPCENACPAGVNIPAFVAYTAEGRYKEALQIHLDRNPFPLACGLTCTHPCETKCRRQTLDDPLAIREIKRFMAERGGLDGEYPLPEIMKRNSSEIKTISIIGGGPAGLTAAYFLKRLGHNVKIYEAQEKLGGMMRYGIPEYRYPKAILDNEIANIISLGIDVSCSTKVGKDITLNEIKANSDATIISVGGWKSRKLNLPGEDADGVISGTEFLWLIAHNDLKEVKGTVIIIGGGSTAIDAARSALRLGADSVILAYRRTIDQMPAEQEEIDELIDEGIYPTELTNISEILIEDGKVIGIRCSKQELGDFDKSGRKAPRALPGKDNTVIFEGNYLIAAISQEIDMSFAGTIVTNKDGSVKINPDSLQTSDENIFAAGDATKITNLAIAIGQGEKAAVSIEQKLNPNKIKKFSWRILKSPDVFFDFDQEPVETPRVQTEYSSVAERITNFLLVNRGVNWEDKIQKEANRCLRCEYREELSEELEVV